MKGKPVAIRQTETAPTVTDASIIESVVINGDLSKLTPAQRVAYYQRTCETMGLNPFTRPFDYIQLSGKLTLYAKRDCCDQLRKINGISIEVVDKRITDGIAITTVRARTPDGRCDEDIGAVTVSSAKGDALANAFKKSITQAKRRVTLSICGLGWLDETEVEQVPGAQAPPPGYTTAAIEPDVGFVTDAPKVTPRTELYSALLARVGGDEAIASKSLGIIESIQGEIDERVLRGQLDLLAANPPPACPICAGRLEYSTRDQAEQNAYDARFADRKQNIERRTTPCAICEQTGEFPPKGKAAPPAELPLPGAADELSEAYDMADNGEVFEKLEIERAALWKVLSKDEKAALKSTVEKARKRIAAIEMDKRAEQTLEAMGEVDG